MAQIKTHALATGIWLVLASQVSFAQEADNAPATQSADAADPTTLDRIEVTGSRIRHVDIETAQPIQMITRDEIDKQGFESVADILQNISSAGSPAISRQQPLSAGPSVGGTYLDLRNIGTQRTLILINGKRIGMTVDGLQDLSTIPASIIERVEVLKDGASAVYGSDAIGGVVNLITRRNFDGAEASAYIGTYSQGDGTKQIYSGIAGFAGERGSLTAAVEYAKEETVWASDRWFSAYPDSSRHPDQGWSAISHRGGFVLANPDYDPDRDTSRANSPTWRWVLDEGGNPYDFTDYHRQAIAPDNSDNSNTNRQMMLLTPLTRRAVYLDGTVDITENLRWRTTTSVMNRVLDTQVAGYPVSLGAVGPAATLSADSYYNPVGRWHGADDPRAVEIFRRTWEMPRRTEYTLDVFRFDTSLQGSFDIADRFFDWDLGYLLVENKQRQHTTGNLNKLRMAKALGPSFLNGEGRVQCGTAANPIPFSECVPWNPLLPFGRAGDGGLTDNTELQRYLMTDENDFGVTETSSYYANLTGSLFELPAGELGFAVGAESRKESGRYTPDMMAQSGDSTNLAAGPTGGEYSVMEYYGELNVPVLADAPLAKELTLNVASRVSDYDTFGSTTNSKFGLKWRPLDQLLVRGTIAEGFRAPAIADLYGGTSDSFSFYTDPCDTRFGNAANDASVRARCEPDVPNANTFRQLGQGGAPTTTASAQTEFPFRAGSNPDLVPETSKSKTLGLVWSPPFVEGMNVSLDWWTIRIEDTIVGDSPDTILRDCYVRGIAERCRAFTRDPVTGVVRTLSFGNQNAGYVETEGYDLELAYRRATDLGTLGVDWSTTYTSRAVIKSSNDDEQIELPINGIASNDFGVGFRIRSVLGLSWEKGPFGLGWTARYFSGVKEDCTYECSDPDFTAPWSDSGKNRIGSNTFHDVQFRVTLPWSANVALGANNVFERYSAPFYSAPANTHSYYGGFDIGRFIYLKYQQKF